MASIGEGSLFDIRNGVLLLDGNQAGKIEAFVNGGRMVGFDGAGTVNCDFDERNEGKTTVTAVHPFEPFPSTEGSIVPAGNLQLSRTLPGLPQKPRVRANLLRTCCALPQSPIEWKSCCV